MESRQNKLDTSNKNLSEIEKDFHSNSFANLSYLYPNGHRSTPQMRWFKGSRDRGLDSDKAA